MRCTSEFPYYPAVQQMVKWYREGAFGRIIEARFAIRHSSDMDLNKPINWKRMRNINGDYGCMATWVSTPSICPSIWAYARGR